MAFSKNLRVTILASLLVLNVTTSAAFGIPQGLTNPITSTNQQQQYDEYDDASDSSDNTTTTDGIPHRSLALAHLPHPHEPTVHTPTGAAIPHDKPVVKSACKPNTKGGKCGPQYTSFVQIWVPSMSRAEIQDICISCVTADEIHYVNSHLLAQSLIPYKSPIKHVGGPGLSDAQKKKIDPKKWFNGHVLKDTYSTEWKKHGAVSGLTADEFIHEIQRLQNEHQTTNKLFQETKETFVNKKQLEEAFNKHACLECKDYHKKEGGIEQYFHRVSYCYEVNPQTHHPTKKIVAYAPHCGTCPNTCTERKILLPKFPEVSPKVSGEHLKSQKKI